MLCRVVAQKLRVHKAFVGTDTIQHQLPAPEGQGPALRSVEVMGHSAVTKSFLQSQPRCYSPSSSSAVMGKQQPPSGVPLKLCFARTAFVSCFWELRCSPDNLWMVGGEWVGGGRKEGRKIVRR